MPEKRFHDPCNLALSPEIISEINAIDNSKWVDWAKGTWHVYPLFCFDFWCEKNCASMPALSAYLRSIKGVRLAFLSKLNARSKTPRVRGWDDHANHVLRHQYGVKVRHDTCFVSVKDSIEEIKYQSNGNWTVYDNSEEHYVFNTGDSDAITLVIDIERAEGIPHGTSTIKRPAEIDSLIAKMKDCV